jgi:cell envelope-related transcriptional attenuator-like protein
VQYASATVRQHDDHTGEDGSGRPPSRRESGRRGRRPRWPRLLVLAGAVGHDRNGKVAAPYHINSDGTVGRAVPGVTPQVYDVGPHDFTPSQALDYVRQRDKLANSDFDHDRQRHQQQFIKAIAQKLLSTGVLTDLGKLSQVFDAMGRAMTIDTRA